MKHGMKIDGKLYNRGAVVDHRRGCSRSRAAPGSGRRLKFLRAMLDMVEGGDGIIGETEKSRAYKEEIRAEIHSLQNVEVEHE